MSKYGQTPTGPGEYRETGAKAVKPRDAATLIIVKNGDTPRVLMGKRAATHKFMPNKFVFPGGRLDYIDQRLRVTSTLPAPVMVRLTAETRRNVSANKLTGLALASIRETFEETGLIVGTPSDKALKSSNNIWQAYFDHGVEPPLEKMDLIARAITPPYRTRRFDTRFFMVHDDALFDTERTSHGPSGELLDLHWLTLDEARERELPAITRMILDVVEERLVLPRAKQLEAPAPFVRFIKSKPVTSNL